MKEIAEESVDLLLTDPPFGIKFHRVGSQYNRKQRELGKLYIEIPQEDYYKFTVNWLKAAYRVMKPTASGFVFSGWNNLSDILNAFTEVGFRLVNHIIWKYQFGVFTKKRFTTSHYHILYITKLPLNRDKERTFNRIAEYTNSKVPGKLYFEDVWFIKRDYQKGGKKTPTRLPLEITDKCVRMGSNKNDLVLEPFCGSGSVILSCLRHSRRYIGFEKSQPIFEIAEERINQFESKLREKPRSLEHWLEQSKE
ncbi:MAG: DNA-methyltransferase [Candidatus Hodarchaeales archaeon]